MDNPRGPPGAAPMQLYAAEDVARLALRVHGGGDLEGARAVLRALRRQAADREARREAVKKDMAQRSRERAAAFVATTRAQQLCKQLHVDPYSQLTKTAALDTFGLSHYHLASVPCTSRVGVVRRDRAWRAMLAGLPHCCCRQPCRQ